MSVLTYPFRLLFWAFASPNVTCKAKWCARPQVGFSVWCRFHTDEILNAKPLKETTDG